MFTGSLPKFTGTLLKMFTGTFKVHGHFFVKMFTGTFKIHGHFFDCSRALFRFTGTLSKKVHGHIPSIHGHFPVKIHGHFFDVHGKKKSTAFAYMTNYLHILLPTLALSYSFIIILFVFLEKVLKSFSNVL